MLIIKSLVATASSTNAGGDSGLDGDPLLRGAVGVARRGTGWQQQAVAVWKEPDGGASFQLLAFFHSVPSLSP